MVHTPVNHHLRPLYRALAGLVGLFILAFGVIGLIMTWGEPLFARESNWALGLRTNLAFSLLSVVLGLILVAGYLIGGDISHAINYYGSWVLLAAGIAILAVLQTDLNIFNWSMTNVIVSLALGTVVLVAGLYDKAGDAEAQSAEETFRQGPKQPARP